MTCFLPQCRAIPEKKNYSRIAYFVFKRKSLICFFSFKLFFKDLKRITAELVNKFFYWTFSNFKALKKISSILQNCHFFFRYLLLWHFIRDHSNYFERDSAMRLKIATICELINEHSVIITGKICICLNIEPITGYIN